ncbi:MAG: sulfatase-like hydrolase/transferase [Candidatus Latescibacteria bacterium]|nr:sulfatase-like hydrolase/transferase [Candidatus Latescibacterota bacterium]
MSQSRPNFLLIMSDEHAPRYSGTYGHPLVQTPHMDRLAARGVTFDNAYCNTPLCGPSRMSFMTGRHIQNIGAYDNAFPLPSDTLTWAHRLGAAGYQVDLAGKQHFCGTDQLHGFGRQLARDLHAELWTKNGVPRGCPNWDDDIKEGKPWGSLAQAGPGHTTEIEVDDQVEEVSLAYIRDPARKERPWCLNASFIAPHFPLVAPQRFWDMYPPESVDMPELPPGHLDNLHPVYQRMRRAFGCIDFPEELVRRGRAGYYALITYLDEKIGRLMDALEETGQLDNTVIVYTSDHGDMNGEHGMWRKSNFYQASAGVPLQIAWPAGLPQGRREEGVVSLVDLVATVLDLAGVPGEDEIDGDSLVGLMRGGDFEWKDEALCEYLAHGVQGPMAMLRQGRYKFNYSLGDQPELYDIVADSSEFADLAQDPAHAETVARLQASLLERWDPVELDRRVRASQGGRLLIERAGHS